MRKHKSQKRLSIESWSAYINTKLPSKSQNTRVNTKYTREKYKYLNIGKDIQLDTTKLSMKTMLIQLNSLLVLSKSLRNNTSVMQTLSENREKEKTLFNITPDTKTKQKYYLPKHNQIYPMIHAQNTARNISK